MILVNHCLNKRPKSIMGSKVIKINIKGTISWNNKALIVYVIANNNLALGSRLWGRCRNGNLWGLSSTNGTSS